MISKKTRAELGIGACVANAHFVRVVAICYPVSRCDAENISGLMSQTHHQDRCMLKRFEPILGMGQAFGIQCCMKKRAETAGPHQAEVGQKTEELAKVYPKLLKGY